MAVTAARRSPPTARRRAATCGRAPGWPTATCTAPGVTVGVSAGTITWGVSVWGSRGLPGCPARWTPCPTAARTSGGRLLHAGQQPGSGSRQRTWAPKQHCLVGGFREILANCGAAVSIWTTGTTAVQLGASTTTNAGGQFSLSFAFTCPAAGTLPFLILRPRSPRRLLRHSAGRAH
jgi:hypothetical protein